MNISSFGFLLCSELVHFFETVTNGIDALELVYSPAFKDIVL